MLPERQKFVQDMLACSRFPLHWRPVKRHLELVSTSNTKFGHLDDISGVCWSFCPSHHIVQVYVPQNVCYLRIFIRNWESTCWPNWTFITLEINWLPALELSHLKVWFMIIMCCELITLVSPRNPTLTVAFKSLLYFKPCCKHRASKLWERRGQLSKVQQQCSGFIIFTI